MKSVRPTTFPPKYPNPKLEETLDKLFPKGDKARGRALALFGVAEYEIYTVELKVKKELKFKMIKKIKEELKEKIRNKKSKSNWITILRKELKEELIDNL